MNQKTYDYFHKIEVAEEIGNYFGDFFEENDQFCIDNGERIFRYDDVDSLLVDWLDTLIENHHDNYYIDKHGQELYGWDKEIEYIYSNVIGNYPSGVRPVPGKDSTNWACSVDVSIQNVTSPHGKNFHLGTYSSIVDAIYARKKFMDFLKSHPDKNLASITVFAKRMQKSAKDKMKLISQLKNNQINKKLIDAVMEFGMANNWCDSDVICSLTSFGLTYQDFIQAGYKDFFKDYFEDSVEEKPSLSSQIQSAASRTGESQTTSYNRSTKIEFEH